MDYLLLLSIIASIVVFFIFSINIYQRKWNLSIKAALIGLLFAFIDLAVEYLGTSRGIWKYNYSLWFLFGSVPIELLLLFFSAGAIAVVIYYNTPKIRKRLPIHLKVNYLLYIFILGMILLFTHDLFLFSKINLLLILIPVGLWGIINIKQNNLEPVLYLAILIFIADTLLELFIIRSGSYDYMAGFNWMIPMTYSLILIGMFGLFERLDRLDNFLDHKVIAFALRSAGIIREKLRTVEHRIRKRL